MPSCRTTFWALPAVKIMAVCISMTRTATWLPVRAPLRHHQSSANPAGPATRKRGPDSLRMTRVGNIADYMHIEEARGPARIGARICNDCADAALRCRRTTTSSRTTTQLVAKVNAPETAVAAVCAC